MRLAMLSLASLHPFTYGTECMCMRGGMMCLKREETKGEGRREEGKEGHGEGKVLVSVERNKYPAFFHMPLNARCKPLHGKRAELDLRGPGHQLAQCRAGAKAGNACTLLRSHAT